MERKHLTCHMAAAGTSEMTLARYSTADSLSSTDQNPTGYDPRCDTWQWVMFHQGSSEETEEKTLLMPSNVEN